MQFYYQPEGADRRSWDFAPGKLMNAEAEAIERLTKLSYGEWLDAMERGSMAALHGLLYVLLKRDNPTLRYDQVQFSYDEVGLELTNEEMAERIVILRDARATEGLSEEDERMLDLLQSEYGGDLPELPAGEDVVSGDVIPAPKAASSRARKSA